MHGGLGGTDGRMDGWMDGRTDGLTDGWTDGRTNGRTDERTDGWTDGRTDGQTDGTDGRMEGRTDGRTDERTTSIWHYVLKAHEANPFRLDRNPDPKPWPQTPALDIRRRLQAGLYWVRAKSGGAVLGPGRAVLGPVVMKGFFS